MTRTGALAVPPATEAARPRQTSGSQPRGSLDEASRARRFEALFVSHLDAAYNFARWLARDDRNAEENANCPDHRNSLLA